MGRTGAGKSSIFAALFRMYDVEIEDLGGIWVDGVDVRELGLHTLRRNMSVIPQTPFIFQGNVRENIDPLGHASEEQIWQALEDVQLGDFVGGLKEGLDTLCMDASGVFSSG